MENFTIAEFKQWNIELGQQLTCRPFEELIIRDADSVGQFNPDGSVSVHGESCSKWTYDSDHGFQSLTSEVRDPSSIDLLLINL